MPSISQRIKTVVVENVEVDGQALDVPDDLNISLTDAGVSSMDIVALAKMIAQEFDMEFSAEDCVQLGSLRAVAEALESRSA
ncbi:MAG: acyl carrier protein [Acidimicrobiia bacterium]|nr:acyl carrier protein [bacterium]MXX63671.1 acyl carrier protein [Acidimicrobiia bacterium]MCY3580642.1 acyl carrier protein [bacterium]MCY3651580.1 acyl carrier protein [bacterium]MDE0644601.1 acyl carrier protein [bacterium]